MTFIKRPRQGTIKAVIRTKDGKAFIAAKNNKNSEKSILIRCPVCNKEISTKMEKSHIKSSHPHLDTETLKLKNSYINCVKCGANIKKLKYKAHMKNTHGTIFQDQQPENLTSNTKLKQPKKKKLKLISKRASRMIGNSSKCDNCNKIKPLLWHYVKSNRGDVNICSFCKPKVKARSFGSVKTDALDLAETGGSFEGDRRRH